MKSAIKNINGKISQKNIYEEISDFPETISDSAVIDGAETFGEDSIVELDLTDFEELSGMKGNYLKSMTIIDEFENDLDDKYGSFHKFVAHDNEFNLEQLTNQIDNLISVQKRKEIILPPKTIVPSIPEIETAAEEEIDEISRSKSASEKDVEKIAGEQVKKETGAQKEIISEIKEKKSGKEEKLHIQEKENAKLEELENIEDKLLKRVLEKLETQKKEEKKENDKRKNYIDITSVIPEHKNPTINNVFIYEDDYEEHMPEENDVINYREEPAKFKNENSFMIEIPDKLLDELPEDFNLDELGKIDLNEAELIAEEDLLYLAKDGLLKQLEGLNILPQQDADQQEKTEKTAPKAKPAKKTETLKKKTEETDIIKEENKKNESLPEIEKIELKETKENNKDKTIYEQKQDEQEFSISTMGENARFEILDITDETPSTETHITTDSSAETETAAEVQFDYVPVDSERKDENVFIVESTEQNADKKINISSIDELETLTSAAAEIKGGKPRQLIESELEDSEILPGSVTNNYDDDDAAKDSSNEVEFIDQNLNPKDDIISSYESISSVDERETIFKSGETQTQQHDETESNTTQYELILGPIADDLEQAENNFVDEDSILPEPTFDKAGIDQYKPNADKLSKYKYILPSPDSLLDDEKKSIEDDISGDTALIFEEDVTRIQKKLDDSTKKEIENTIHDITDKVTILEENKNNKEAATDNQKDKEEIKKLLGYLDKLFEKLPEENIKNFADSEYYELYKKLL